MKNKIFKIITVVLLLATLTMTNLAYVGASLISYAESGSATNHQNVEFDVQLKENTLSMKVSVKKEGYFNGEIALENSNFNIKADQKSEYINKIEGNKITLNQLNAGTTAQMEIEIEPIQKEIFEVGLLNVVSKLNLTGTYKDSTQRDIKIKAEREVSYQYPENNTEENIENSVEVITNKVITVSGEDKKVLQLSINLGLKDNNYPIKEMSLEMKLPKSDIDKPTIEKKVNFNTMTYYKFNHSGEDISFTFTNNPNEENKIIWEKQGNENIVLTLIYNKDEELENKEFVINENITLYNEKTLTATKTFDVNSKEEKEAIIQVEASNKEDTIYKGKLYAGIDRQYESTTNVQINLANAQSYINIKEDATKYVKEGQESVANVVYNKTIIKKEIFDSIFGENGSLKIANENGQIIAMVDKNTVADENDNIVIDYTGKEPSAIEITTSIPVAVGNLELIHTKTIKAGEEEAIKNAAELNTKITYSYASNFENNVYAVTKLEETTTETRLEINKQTLSTVIANDVEIKAILKANSEKYNLYKNPTFVFELPEDVESIQLTSDPYFIYENELKVKDYNIVNGRILTISVEGEQTSYKDLSIEGAVLIIKANIVVNKKAATKDGQIIMKCEDNNVSVTDSKTIKIVAPKDITTINSIKDLDVETIGEEETKQITLQRGSNEKQLETEIEVINNNENAIEDVKIIGNFPSKNSQNNMDIKIIDGIKVQGTNEANVYYTENENATDDLQNMQNGWSSEINNLNSAKKYLITIPKMDTQADVIATYKIEIPSLLEYNQIAREGYNVVYTNSLTNTTNQIKATTIELQTGVGPQLETKLTPMVGGEEITSNSVVKNGEVIKYKMEVSNVGSEDITDITVQGNVPEGTTLVTPQDNYEYTGASYYKELQNKTYEAKIDILKVGEVLTGEYEVRVNSDTKEGTVLKNTTQIKYKDVIKKSNETQLTTQTGNLRISVKRVTDRNEKIYESGAIRYFAIIENISDDDRDNVRIKTNPSSAIKVTAVELMTGMKSKEISDDIINMYSNDEYLLNEAQELSQDNSSKDENIQSEELQYSEEINIGTLKAGEVKVLSYDAIINKVDNTNAITFAAVAKEENNEYKSNVVSDEVIKANVSLSMSTNTQSQYVKSGDTIEYTITVKNNEEERIEGVTIKDTIPDSLTVNKVTFEGEEIEELKGINDIEILCNLASGLESTIKIEAVVNYSEGRTHAEPITNVAYAEFLSEKIATTAEINHIIEANQTDNEGGNTSGDTSGNADNGDIANGNKMITGLAWYDENANGKKDDNEQLLSGITVKLLNTKTNNMVKNSSGSILETKTNENGLYALDNIRDGSYIVIFEYEDTKYALTTYKADNVEEAKNSNAMTSELNIEGQRKQVASTDILEVSQENIPNINIGLIELKDFSFKLDKFVNRILIQDASGTTIKEYTDSTIAKAELDRKTVDGASVIIEYKIKVTNIGELDGYVRKIVDYIPNDLKFSSELNKDWSQASDGLSNSSLANEKIKAGESKEVILTLTKAMTEDNTGLINNTAEIAESYNELGISDSKSTSGNKAKGESDMGSADAILSLKTGAETYVSIILGCITVLGIIVFTIIRVKSIKGDKK